MPQNTDPVVSPPSSIGGGGPAAYAQNLVAWAGHDPAKLTGAFLEGNGRTQVAFLRRLTIDDLTALRAVLATREPLPFSTQPFGVFEVDRELRRRAARAPGR